MLVVACTAQMVKEGAETPTPPPAVEPAPAQPESCARGTWCYSKIVSPMITNDMMLADVSMACKSAPQDRRRLWTSIVQAISYAESSYKYDSEYTENFISDYTGKLAVSVGMLQLSIGDKRKASPNCQALTEAKLRQAVPNLACGVEIMHWLITRKGSKHSFLDLNAYWSVTRLSNGRFSVFQKKLKELEPSC